METIDKGTTTFAYGESNVRTLIKVVGVGGGGGNAVSKMYETKSVAGVSFLLCNTDEQALEKSPVPHKLVLGRSKTEGLGAGNKPRVAEEAARLSEDEIREALKQGDTKMVFITAGMGGGTGTGAAPVVGRIAMEAGLLTIGIVTIPFEFEGRNKIIQALKGVREMQKNVDALIVINNEKLIEVWGKLPLRRAFAKADETLSNAVSGISNMINSPLSVNVDFADVESTLKGGGVAIINTGVVTEEVFLDYNEDIDESKEIEDESAYIGRDAKPPHTDRCMRAIKKALHSPLLNNHNINNAKKLLICIATSPEGDLGTDEIMALTEFTSRFEDFDVIFGYGSDSRITNKDTIEVTVLASGFSYEDTERNIMRLKAPIDIEITEKGKKDEEQLIDTYYGPNNRVGKKPIYTMEPFLLHLDELDDDDFINIIEATPSFKRNIRTLEDLRKRKTKVSVTATPPTIDMGYQPIVTSSPDKQEDTEDIITGFD